MTATSTNSGLDLEDQRASTAVVPVVASTDLVPIETATPNTITAPGPVAGAGLVAEAEAAVRQHRWRDALRVLNAIDSIGASSVHTDGLLAVAATHVKKKRLAAEAVGRIRASTPTLEGHRSLAAVALARHHYLTADTEGRAALELAGEGGTASDWSNLAAGYAGLGWFEEAATCLDRAEQLDLDESDTWIIGRSINRWAMSKTWALAISAGLFLFVGLLAVAIGITVPFIVRELRLTQLDGRLTSLANDAWANERWLRLAHATGVLLTVIAWSVAVQII